MTTPRNPQPARPVTVTTIDPKMLARIERLTRLLLPGGIRDATEGLNGT